MSQVSCGRLTAFKLYFVPKPHTNQQLTPDLSLGSRRFNIVT
jgi:hypothetical protein